MVNFCDADSEDNTCNVETTYFPSLTDVEFSVVNVGDDIEDNEFICLIDNSGENDDHIINVDTITEDDLLPQTDIIQDYICDENDDTPSPTDNPTNRPTPKPTNGPTDNPTPRPTPKPTNNPTNDPTPRPTPKPTNNPTNDPTPRPTPKPTNGPTSDPTNRPTPKPTNNPTNDPTNRPTPKPTDNPTPRPTPKPTNGPTSDPTNRPTPKPTNNPTNDPTPRPTPKPTDNPTPRPTPKPTNGPTSNPTPGPTHVYCDEIEDETDVIIIVSTGCGDINDEECGIIRSFLSDIVEKIFNPTFVRIAILLHGGSFAPLAGERDVLLGYIDDIECNDDSVDNIDYDGAVNSAYNIFVSNSVGRRKEIIMINLCEPETGDTTCTVESDNFPTLTDVEYTVVNVGDDISGNTFNCLIDNSGQSPDDIIDVPDITDEDLMGETDNVQDNICNVLSNAPTDMPTPGPTDNPTPRPTPKPTDNPTPRPTPKPTNNPTNDPTNRPTPKPTDNPTPRPTPKPTNGPTSDPTPGPTDNPTSNPTPGPTHVYCDEIEDPTDVVIIVSTGCAGLDDTECGTIRSFLSDIVEKIFNPFFVRMAIIVHGSSPQPFHNDRDEILEYISNIECNDDNVDDVDYDGAVTGAYNVFEANSAGRRKEIIMINLCDPEPSDETCNVESDNFPALTDVEYTVVNVGSGIAANQFNCLIDNSGQSPDDIIDVANIDDEDLMGETDNVQDNICNVLSNAPTDMPTPGPTDDPTPGPTNNPTPGPTDNPTPGPTDNPTSNPTDNPTPGPTDNPTPGPTDNPTTDPTDNPTPGPTNNPTLSPTHEYCDITFDLDIIFVVDNGCALTSDECESQNEFLEDIVEKVFNPDYTRMGLINYNEGFEIQFSLGDGNRDETIAFVANLLCGNDNSYEPADSASGINEAIVQFDDKSNNGIEKKIIMINYCNPEPHFNENVTCALADDLDSREIEVIVINAGDKIDDNTYTCLVNDLGNDYFDVDNIDDASLMGISNDVQTEACDKPTSSPTDEPTRGPTDNPTPGPTNNPTPGPTDGPTSNPTDNPTPGPTDEPTPGPSDNPTPGPTGNPTPGPTNNPTPGPTDEPTPGPTHEYCETPHTSLIFYMVSTGCQLTTDECSSGEMFLTDLVEKTYDPNTDAQTVIYYSPDIESNGAGDRDLLLSNIGNEFDLYCNDDGSPQNVDYDAVLADQLYIASLLAPSYDEVKIVFISFCNPDATDDTCNVPATYDTSNGKIEYIVIDAGDQIDDGTFACLTNSGTSSDANYFYIPSIDDEILMGQADIIEDEICERPTSSPTDMPTPGPTNNPTPGPTNVPSKSPTNGPTGVTLDPTAAPLGNIEISEECEKVFDEKCESFIGEVALGYCSEEDTLACKDGTYHSPPGCNQCEDGTFKLDYQFPCLNCQEYTGIGCLTCTDYQGCQQCTTGYELVEDTNCVDPDGQNHQFLRYCQACTPFIELRFQGDEKWVMDDGQSEMEYVYSNFQNDYYYLDETSETFLFADTLDGNTYIMLLEQLFLSTTGDDGWYLVIKDSNAASGDYSSAIYYVNPTSDWPTNGYAPSDTVRSQITPSTQWLCVSGNAACHVYTMEFNVFNSCTQTANRFCSGEVSNYPDFVDCTGGVANYIASGTWDAKYHFSGMIVSGIIMIVLSVMTFY